MRRPRLLQSNQFTGLAGRVPMRMRPSLSRASSCLSALGLSVKSSGLSLNLATACTFRSQSDQRHSCKVPLLLLELDLRLATVAANRYSAVS